MAREGHHSAQKNTLVERISVKITTCLFVNFFLSLPFTKPVNDSTQGISSACTQEASDLRNELCEVLKSAGMEVLSEQDLAPAQQATQVSALLKESNTAVVILEPKSIRLEAEGRPVFWLPYLMQLAEQETEARAPRLQHNCLVIATLSNSTF